MPGRHRVGIRGVEEIDHQAVFLRAQAIDAFDLFARRQSLRLGHLAQDPLVQVEGAQAEAPVIDSEGLEVGVEQVSSSPVSKRRP